MESNRSKNGLFQIIFDFLIHNKKVYDVKSNEFIELVKREHIAEINAGTLIKQSFQKIYKANELNSSNL